MRKPEREMTMTYEECLEFCTKRLCVMGYFPDEIEEAAKKMFEEENEDSSCEA
jgi:hypothetical protein